MKNMKKLLVIVMAIAITMAMSATAFADTLTINPGTPSDGSGTPTYNYYLMIQASIKDDNGNKKVSYYVEKESLANALDGLKVDNEDLFTVTKANGANRWNVKINSKFSAEEYGEKIAAALDTIKDEAITSKENTKDTTFESAKGYVLVESSLGTKLIANTVVTRTINEKNSYPGIEKTIASDDSNTQIGDDVNYTLNVTVPATANAKIVVTDKMSTGLTFKSIDSVKAGNDAVDYTASEVDNDNTFTITFDKATVIANQGKTIAIQYTAVLNSKAEIDTSVPNKAKIKYNNEYETAWKEVNTETASFTFDKVDGQDNSKKLSGAVFQLKKDDAVLKLVEVEAGKTYRVAMSGETTVDKITTNGNTVTINGLDKDVTYQLVETVAPEGYNQLENPVEVKAGNTGFAHQNVENLTGSTLPSTGGIGTTIFYVVGALLVVGCGIFLVARRRASKEEE